MTPLPKRRWSTRRQGKKRATQRINEKTGGRCANCGGLVVNHTVCPKCGYYKGKPVIAVKTKKEVENRR